MVSVKVETMRLLLRGLKHTRSLPVMRRRREWVLALARLQIQMWMQDLDHEDLRLPLVLDLVLLQIRVLVVNGMARDKVDLQLVLLHVERVLRCSHPLLLLLINLIQD